MALTTESTTFTKDVLGRYTCSTWEEATTNPEGIDVVVLGAGLYGGYLAAKVYELAKAKFGDQFQGLRVLVLEAGPYAIPGHTANIPNLGFYDPGFNTIDVGPGSNPGIRNEVWGVGWRSNQPFVGQAYCVGGKGIFWGGWCPRLQKADLDQWPEEVHKYLTTVDPAEPIGRRPIEHKNLATGAVLHRGDPLTGYETLEYEIGVSPSDDFVFDPLQSAGPGPRKVGLNEAVRVFLQQQAAGINAQTPGRGITETLPGPIAVQTQSFVSGLFALDKYSSVPALTAAARSDHGGRGEEYTPRMALVPNCHVVRLGFRGDKEAPERGTRVVNRIDVRVGGANRSLALAPHCQVVLAMSAIESTRLALESFSLAGSGLRDANDELIGRNYMIHLRADISFSVDRAQFANWVSTRWPGNTLADNLQQATVHVQCDGPNGRYQYQLFAATNAGGPDPNMYQMVPDLDVQRQIANGFDAHTIRVILRGSAEVVGGRNRPYRDGNFDYIDLTKAGDFDQEFGHARAWVQFNRQDHSADAIWQDLHDTGHAIARALAGPGVPDYLGGNFSLAALKTQQGVGTTFHDAGTLWMGDRPDQSVTDVNGHFHHVTNAYCADQGLFTTIGSANPALTGLVLARKVAGDIVARHAGYARPSTLQNLVPQSLLDTAGWLAAPYNGMTILDRTGGGLLETDPVRGIGLWYLPTEMGDFDLAIDWKAFRTAVLGADIIANAGILLRTPDPRGVNFNDGAQFDAFYDAVTEVQIDETGKRYEKSSGQSVFGDSRYKTGAIYGVAPATQWAAQVAAPDGAADERYWNTYEISARGQNVQVVLNGKLVCETGVPPSKNHRGFLALQFHTGRVRFRNLRVGRIT